VRAARLPDGFAGCIMHRVPLHAYTPARADPLRLLRRPAVRHGRTESTSSPLRHSRSSSPHYDEPSEKTKREQSVKVNRHHKFVECLSREDVDMGSFPLSLPAQVYLTLGLLPFFFFSLHKRSSGNWLGQVSPKIFVR